MSTLTYKNTQISYTDSGKGNVLVLLHGFLENQKMWDYFIPVLIQKNRVITIDLLGHGTTESMGYIHTMEEMAACIDAVLTSLRIKKANIVGHSLGGYVALAFAELFPEKTRAIMLLNSTEKEDSPERKINRDRAIDAVKTNRELFIQIAISNLFNPENSETFASEINIVKQEALNTPLQGVLAAINGMKIRKDRSFLLEKTNLPVHIVVGKKDPVLDYTAFSKQQYIPHIKIHELPDGHMSYIENRDDVEKLLLLFSKIK